MKPASILWGRIDDEVLIHKTAEEAIESIIEDFDPADDETIVVWEFKRREIPSVDYIRDGLIDWLRDDFDSEYGNPDDETTIPNEVFIAADKFAKVVQREWPVWTMDRTENKVSVNVGEWRKVHEK